MSKSKGVYGVLVFTAACAMTAYSHDVDSIAHQFRVLDECLGERYTQQRNWERRTGMPVVSFRAYHVARDKDLVVGQVLVYQKLMDNVAGGYWKKTGVFRAPYSGYYLFHLSVNPRGHNKTIEMHLVKNNGMVLLKFVAGDVDETDYQDGSCIAKVLKGQKVFPIVANADSGARIYTRRGTWDSYFNKFDGYLIKEL